MGESENIRKYFEEIISKNWLYLSRNIKKQTLWLITLPQVHIHVECNNSRRKVFFYLGTPLGAEKDNLLLLEKVNRLILSQTKYDLKLIEKKSPSQAYPKDNPSVKYCGSALIYKLT